MDHPQWRRRWLERVGLALAERGSRRSFAWFVGYGSGASLRLRWDALAPPAPVLSNRPRCWQLIPECLHGVARPERFRDPRHHETWSPVAALRDTSHTELRQVSCPAPAPRQRHRDTVPMNKPLVGCSDLPLPIFFDEVRAEKFFFAFLNYASQGVRPFRQYVRRICGIEVPPVQIPQ